MLRQHMALTTKVFACLSPLAAAALTHLLCGQHRLLLCPADVPPPPTLQDLEAELSAMRAAVAEESSRAQRVGVST
jgi:hypothetical protein